MYDYIKGILISERRLPSGNVITVEAGGIGYSILTTERTLQELPDKNSEIKIYVSLMHREDAMYFCGFLKREERDIFEILLTVSGVGMKAALTLTDEFSVTELIGVVISENFRELSRAKGIGLKSAQKIVLELKDKLLARQDYLLPENETEPNVIPEYAQEAKSVLYSLGYSKEEIEQSIKNALNIPNIKKTSEEILSGALRYLANNNK